MRLVRYSILTLIAISSFSLVKVPPVKADIFDMLRGLSACEDECLRKYDEAKLILISEQIQNG